MNDRLRALWANNILRDCLLEAGDDVDVAIEAANYIIATQPVPEDFALSVDTTGHEHRGKGPHGGEFTGHGGGGGDVPAKKNGKLHKLKHHGKAAVAWASRKEHAATKWASKTFAKLPAPIRWPAAIILKTSFASYIHLNNAARAVAREKGGEEHANRVAKLLVAVDLIGAKAGPMAAKGMLGVGAAAAIATSFVPIGSSTYLVYSLARNPIATFKAAKKAVQKVLHRKPASIAAALSTEGREADIGELLELYQSMPKDQVDWFDALVHAALDETGSLDEAIEVAKAVLERGGSAPMSVDDLGNVHDDETGRFTKKHNVPKYTGDAKNVQFVSIDKLFEHAEASQLIVRYAPGELRELAEDIKRNGLRSPIKLLQHRAEEGDTDPETARTYVSDGRNRLEALRLAGFTHAPVKVVSGSGRLGKRFFDESAPLSINAFFAHDIHNRDAQGILNRSLKAVRGMSAAARADLATALEREDSGAAILEFINKYRVHLARLLTSTQLAALVKGAEEVAAKVPPLGTVPVEGLPVAEQEAILKVAPPAKPPTWGPPAPASGDPEEVHFATIDEAVKNLAGRNVLDKSTYDSLDAAARAKAFTVANVAAEETLIKLRDSLAENVREGADYAAWRKKVLADVDAGTFLSDAHQETVFRTNVQTAFSDGQMSVLSHPLVRSGFPYSAYDAIHDDRVRENHLALEKLGIGGTNIYRNDDPVFQMFRPPWDYNDRCGWTPITVRQAAERGVKEADEWLRTGVEPSDKAHVPMPPFHPPEGFRRAALHAPMSVQLSMQSAVAFAFDPAEKRDESGQWTTGSAKSKTRKQKQIKSDEPKEKEKAAPGSQMPEKLRNRLRELGMVDSFPPAEIPMSDIKIVDTTSDPEELKYKPLMSWSQKTKSGRISRQYRYTQAFHDRNANEKFQRVAAIEPHLDKIKDILRKRMKSENARERDAAAIVSVISETGLRPTDGADSVKHGHYGISSLLGRHVQVVGDEIHLDFIGKEGVRNQTVVSNPANVAYLKTAIAKSKPDEPIFPDATSDHAGAVLKEVAKAAGAPDDVLLKDLRTIKATQFARQVVESFEGPPPPMSGNEKKDAKVLAKAILTMSAKVANILNNTPVMARDNYIHPEVWKQWQQKLAAVV